MLQAEHSSASNLPSLAECFLVNNFFTIICRQLFCYFISFLFKNVNWTPSKMIKLMGERIENEDSVYYWAAKVCIIPYKVSNWCKLI